MKTLGDVSVFFCPRIGEMKSWPCASLPWPSGSVSINIVGLNFYSWLYRKSLIFIFAILHFFPRHQRCITHGTWLLSTVVVWCHCTPNGLSQDSVWSGACEGIWGFEYFRPTRTLSLVARAPIVELVSHRECHCHSLVWLCRLWYLISHTSLRVQRCSLISEEKYHNLYSAIFLFGGFIHSECRGLARGSPLESPPPPLLVLESSGLSLPLLTADVSCLAVANRNVAVTKTFCGNSP